MKKICVLTMLILSSTMSFADTWDGYSSDISWYGETQTAFHISSAAQLKGLADLVNDSQVTFDGCNVYLDSDIDLANKQWTPIGFGNTSFSGGTFNGTFYGNKHAISNMYIDTSALPNCMGIMTVGLFGNMKGTVTELSLTAEIDITKGERFNDDNYYVGGLVAWGENIDHVSVTTTYNCYMSFFNKTSSMGFIAGRAQNVSYAEGDGHTSFYSTSDQSGNFGGIVGQASVVTKCVSKGSIVIPAYPTNSSHIGGIAGVASTITDCIFTGRMSVYDNTYSSNPRVFLGGICAGYDGTIDNVIFAPSSFDTNIGTLYKGMIAPGFTSFVTTNAYYNNIYAGNSETYGTPVTEEFLLSGEILNGFSTDIWEFNSGEYPCIKELKSSADEPINGIAIDKTNFPDVNFRNYLLMQDYGTDGILTEEEIAGITTLSVQNEGISNLKGIEYFAALTNLRCQYNQLTALDVSKNTALIELRCYDNQLTSLDVSNNTALTWLDCSVNQLKDLDVLKNTALKRLYCDVNNLTSLDVSKNTELTELWCNDNQLTALNVSKNTKLTELNCASNQLTSLNVANNTELTILYCYNNQIEGEMMDALINSLPEKEWTYIYVYYEGLSIEGNVMTKSQVAAAKAKGWTPYYTINGGDWYEYEGSEDKPTEPISITLPKIETVNVNSFIQLTPVIEPADAVTDLTWSSDDESIAKVTSKGLVAGIKPGTAIISVRTSNNLIAECFVIVQDVSGIKDVNAGDGSNKTVYTISGQKVTNPVKGGIYIVNGKKVVMK